MVESTEEEYGASGGCQYHLQEAEFAKPARLARNLEKFNPRQLEDRVLNMGAKESLLQRLKKSIPQCGLLYFPDCFPLFPGMFDYDKKIAQDFVLYDAKSPAADTAECMDGLPSTSLPVQLSRQLVLSE